MRISDWSSDVFSSDLIFEPLGLVGDGLDAPGGFEIFQGKDSLIASLNSHGIVVKLDKSIGKIDGGSRILYPGFVIFIPGKTGRAECRERVCQEELISGGEGELKKKEITRKTQN